MRNESQGAIRTIERETHGLSIGNAGRLVLDGNGFTLASEVFAGNASEPGTLETMLKSLEKSNRSIHHKGIVVMDAGIASNENIEWLKSHNYHYLVVSRERRKEDPRESDESVLVRARMIKTK